MPSANRYISLADECSLRLLERPFVYNRCTDELYELDGESFEFLKRCDGTRTGTELACEPDFMDYCLSEGILALGSRPARRYLRLPRRPGGMLRYLELQITSRCNLRCRHCYLSAGDGRDLELENVFRAIEGFDLMNGLRLLVSGGEPLMHRGFWYINERLPDYGFRSVLMTNGTLVDVDTARRLKVNEAQVSLDGLRESHDILRGAGSFDKAVRGIELLALSGKKVSVATMVTSLNLGDFDRLARLLDSLGVTEWNVDALTPAGRLAENRDILPDPVEAAKRLGYGFGGGFHGGPAGFACGAHLCAVSADGAVAKCGFYFDRPAGHISEGLDVCWERMKPVPLSSLLCDCEHLEECRGGCRYRAAAMEGGELGPDPVRCHANGVNVKWP